MRLLAPHIHYMGQVYDNDIQDLDAELARLRKVAWRMDAIGFVPGTNISWGLDNLLGLIPVVGDLMTLAPSVWIVWKAKELGATPGALAFMTANVVVDLLIGSIPLVGDLFDVVYNANIRNYRLLEKNLAKRAARAKEVRTAPKLFVEDGVRA